jgi:NADPH:quinone reductase-like Zn-dependent oxidoreductase
MSSPPSSIKAITIASPKNAETTTVPLPTLRDDYILVRTTAVGLNPTDWKSIDGLSGPNVAGCRVGCDYAGVVEEVGSGVTKPFQKGDRICGVAHGANQGVHEDGAFAEYIVVKGDIAIPIPDNLSDEQAAGLGIGITTVVRSPPSFLLSLRNGEEGKMLTRTNIFRAKVSTRH